MNSIEDVMQKKGLIKVPAKQDTSDKNKEEENPYRKTAKFLFILGAQQAGEVLKSLTQEQIEKIVAELVTIRSVEKEEAEKLLNDFAALYNKTKHSYGGIDTAKDILERAYGFDKAMEIIDSAVPEKMPKPFAYLEGADNETIAELLKNELTAAKVLTLSQLPPQKAAQFISSLADEEKKEIILEMAQTRKIDTNILHDISEAMRKKFAEVNTRKTENINGKDILINILKQLPHGSENEIINALEKNEPELAEEIRNKIFTLEDINGIPDKQIQKFLFKFDDETLLKIMRICSYSVKVKILNNVSETRASRLIQEERLLPPLLKKDCQKAAADFITILRLYEENRPVR